MILKWIGILIFAICIAKSNIATTALRRALYVLGASIAVSVGLFVGINHGYEWFDLLTLKTDQKIEVTFFMSYSVVLGIFISSIIDLLKKKSP